MATLAHSRVGSLVRALQVRMRVDDAGTHAAALAYQLILSVLALAIVALALIGLAEDVLPFDIPEGTEEQFENLTEASATLGVIGFLGVLWTASALARRASRALSVIFRTGLERTVRGSLRAIAATLGLIVLVGALPVLTAVIAAIRRTTGGGLPIQILGLVGTVALEFVLFLLAYNVLTPGKIGWRHHVPGAVVMTIGWQVFKLAGGLVLAYLVSRARLLYGTMAAVVGLLVFLRLGTGLFVFGAELSAIVRERKRG